MITTATIEIQSTLLLLMSPSFINYKKDIVKHLHSITQFEQVKPFYLFLRKSIPEDEDFLEIINNPDHEEYEEMIQWAGGSFDPEHFDKEEVSFDNPYERWKSAFHK